MLILVKVGHLFCSKERNAILKLSYAETDPTHFDHSSLHREQLWTRDGCMI